MRVILDHSLPARIDAIEPLAEAVTNALLGKSGVLAFSVNLCLEEIIVNIIKHGLREAPGHTIHVRIRASDEILEIIIEDDAPRFDPFAQVPEPRLDLGIDQRPVGGLGVYMVKHLMDEAHADYLGSGNRITLRKSLVTPAR